MSNSEKAILYEINRNTVRDIWFKFNNIFRNILHEGRVIMKIAAMLSTIKKKKNRSSTKESIVHLVLKVNNIFRILEHLKGFC